MRGGRSNATRQSSELAAKPESESSTNSGSGTAANCVGCASPLGGDGKDGGGGELPSDNDGSGVQDLDGVATGCNFNVQRAMAVGIEEPAGFYGF